MICLICVIQIQFGSPLLILLEQQALFVWVYRYELGGFLSPWCFCNIAEMLGNGFPESSSLSTMLSWDEKNTQEINHTKRKPTR